MSARAAFLAGVACCLVAIAAIGALAKAAAQTWLTATLTSYHLERRGQNEVNPGIGLEHALAARWRLVGGGYVNSSNELTLYAGTVYTRWSFGPARLGTLVALASGYDAKPVLMAGPSLSIEGSELGLNLIFIPAGKGVIGLQAKWRWH